MKREVQRELLDELPPTDRRAIASRHDLQIVNAIMSNVRIMARTLTGAFANDPPRSIVDLGGGDGTLLLGLAKNLASRWRPSRVVLVDRQSLLSPQTTAQFEALSWHVESVRTDIFEWLERPHPEHADVIVANLFLHHFKEGDLRRLLQLAADQTGFFLACEPRRANFPFVAASLLGFIGCNDVTRHDAKASVRAGFAQNELSELWPADKFWRLRETPAGLFSHRFVAQQTNGRTS